MSRSDMVANRKVRNSLWGTTGCEAYDIRPHENGDGFDLISERSTWPDLVCRARRGP